MSGTPFNLFEELREEWRTRGVGDRVLAEVETQFQSVARRHPVRRLREFADDDGLRDLTQKFHLHLVQGRLEELFAHAGDLEHLRLLLRVRGRQFLSNERRHLDFENVRKRAFEMLETDPHFTHADRAGGGRCWTLAGRGEIDRFTGDPVELQRFARSLATPASVRTLRRDTSTAPRMISDPDLRALLRDICGKASWALGAADLIRILRERLGAWEVETLSLSRELAPGTTIEDRIYTAAYDVKWTTQPT